MNHIFTIKKCIRNTAAFFVCACLLCMVSGCVKNKTEEASTQEIKDGEVSSPDELSQIGVYLDVDKNDASFTDVKYIISGDIAMVSFRYNGVKAELRGSCKYKEYELAGIENNSNGDMVVKDVHGCVSSYYTLDPGRVVFWEDENINYSLYIYVTAADSVLDDILSKVTFESRYNDRPDVMEENDINSRKFAEKIVEVFNNKDLTAMVDMMNYPQELGGGQSVANKDELLSLSKDEIFTDLLLKALNDDNAMEELRLSEDGSEYIIGTNYKNVHFKLMDDGSFLITKINN